MPRTAHPVTPINVALRNVRAAFEGLATEYAMLRRQLQSSVAGSSRGRPAGRTARVSDAQGAPKKRGRAFKFSDEQAGEFRKQVEGGKSAVALAKELKISLPTIYNTLRRAGWNGRRGRRPEGRSIQSAAGTRGAKKRGRAFKFGDEQAGELRKQVEGGKSAVALAKELKISLPTMYSTLKRAGWKRRPGRVARRTARRGRSSTTSSGAKKRGRAFKFSDEHAAEFRKQVEGGKSALALAKELKISLPTVYNTLKRAGWSGRKGRKARAA